MAKRRGDKDISKERFFQIFGMPVGRTAVLTVLAVALILLFSLGWLLGKLTIAEYGAAVTALAGGIVALITLTQPRDQAAKASEADEALGEHVINE